MPDQDLNTRLKAATHPPEDAFFSTLITANHILHAQAVVDAYGHISARNPQDPSTFFLSASVAPALVSSKADFILYNISDAEPTTSSSSQQQQPRGYIERYIHSEIYKRYSAVHSVVHAHAEPVLPFSVGATPLQPVFHIAGVMGPGAVPVWDIASAEGADAADRHSMLVRSVPLGASLAAALHPSTSTGYLKSLVTGAQQVPASPAHQTLLMRGHGFTCVGAAVEEAVYRAVYTCANARVQTASLLLQGVFNMGAMRQAVAEVSPEKGGSKGSLQDVHYLDDKEAKATWEAASTAHAKRPWALWVREVQVNPLYVNELEADDDDDDE